MRQHATCTVDITTCLSGDTVEDLLLSSLAYQTRDDDLVQGERGGCDELRQVKSLQ